MNGTQVRGQKAMPWNFWQSAAWAKEGVVRWFVSGMGSLFPTTATAGSAVSQIPATAGTYTLIPDSAVPSTVAAGINHIRFHLPGAAFTVGGTLTLQYTDGTVILTAALQTAFGTPATIITAVSAGVTIGAGYNPRNAPLGKGIVAVIAAPTLGSPIDVVLDAVGAY